MTVSTIGPSRDRHDRHLDLPTVVSQQIPRSTGSMSPASVPLQIHPRFVDLRSYVNCGIPRHLICVDAVLVAYFVRVASLSHSAAMPEGILTHARSGSVAWSFSLSAK